jgi:hypothetical protein
MSRYLILKGIGRGSKRNPPWRPLLFTSHNHAGWISKLPEEVRQAEIRDNRVYCEAMTQLDPAQFELRNRFMRREALKLSPSERMVQMAAMEKKAMEILRKNPEGYARFLRRNFRKRAIPHGPSEPF